MRPVLTFCRPVCACWVIISAPNVAAFHISGVLILLANYVSFAVWYINCAFMCEWNVGFVVPQNMFFFYTRRIRSH